MQLFSISQNLVRISHSRVHSHFTMLQRGLLSVHFKIMHLHTLNLLSSNCLKWISFFVFTDQVTEVKTDIYVTSFGPVSDTDMVSLAPFLTVHHLLRSQDKTDKVWNEKSSVSLKTVTAYLKHSKEIWAFKYIFLGFWKASLGVNKEPYKVTIRNMWTALRHWQRTTISLLMSSC